MEMSKLSIILVVVLMNPHVHLTMSSNQQKPEWEKLVDFVKGGIFPYCKKIKSGGDKYACRLKQFPKIGFLFCKKPESCEDLLRKELNGLKDLNTRGIETVKVLQTELISGVICPHSKPQRKKPRCSGFFETWVDKTEGTFFHVSSYIHDYAYGTLDARMDKLINVYKKDRKALEITKDYLVKIRQFMTPDTQTRHRCICDLQGFFIFQGGFLVSDTEGIELVPWDKTCAFGGPTARQLFLGVETMIKKIETAIKSTI